MRTEIYLAVEIIEAVVSIFHLILLTVHVLYHGRQMEIASCLDFLWKKQANKELQDMSEMRRHTNQLGKIKLCMNFNIL